MDRPPLNESASRARGSLWANYFVLLYTVIAFGAVLFHQVEIARTAMWIAAIAEIGRAHV